MTSRHSGLPRVQCALIRIKPENKQTRLEGRINTQIDQNCNFLLISKAVLTVYALKVFKTVFKPGYSNCVGRTVLVQSEQDGKQITGLQVCWEGS